MGVVKMCLTIRTLVILACMIQVTFCCFPEWFQSVLEDIRTTTEQTTTPVKENNIQVEGIEEIPELPDTISGELLGKLYTLVNYNDECEASSVTTASPSEPSEECDVFCSGNCIDKGYVIMFSYSNESETLVPTVGPSTGAFSTPAGTSDPTEEPFTTTVNETKPTTSVTIELSNSTLELTT